MSENQVNPLSLAEKDYIYRSTPKISPERADSILDAIEIAPKWPGKQGDSCLYVSTPVDKFLAVLDKSFEGVYTYPFSMVSATFTADEEFIAIVGELHCVYGNHPSTLDRHYMLEIIQNNIGEFKLYLKYQQIIGSYYLSPISPEVVKKLAVRVAEAVSIKLEAATPVEKSRVSFEDIKQKIDKALNESASARTRPSF